MAVQVSEPQEAAQESEELSWSLSRLGVLIGIVAYAGVLLTVSTSSFVDSQAIGQPESNAGYAPVSLAAEGDPCGVRLQRLGWSNSQTAPHEENLVPTEAWNRSSYLASLPDCLRNRTGEPVVPMMPGKAVRDMPSKAELDEYLDNLHCTNGNYFAYRDMRFATNRRPLTRRQHMDGLTRVFRAWSQLMDRWSLPFWLEAGSLVAAVRSGQLLPWDRDLDVGVTTETFEALRMKQQQRPEDVPDGFVLEMDVRPNYENYVEARLFEKGTGIWLDIFRWKQLGPFFARWHATHRYIMPRHLIDPLQPCQLAGVDAQCPFNSTAYLLTYFGSLEPDMAWNSKKQLFLRIV
eukprot:PLAT9784.1.p1 GENE.PLAT9784.1~~PLAT9784.1.p1  ORF type:complete len:362 (-),score=129.43 PLAT9784.1:386-1429(-)